ncbi:hypothetical protein [Mixta intestinalis]|uniref:hypothetical protein n=1 Tax=Mixta intestinalis TaxID=1615494 RepID=UPI001369E18D|nr:hypothetical protein [Mixta intestinalis]
MHNWQRLLSDAHTNAFRVVALSPLLTGGLCGLMSRAICKDMTLDEFYSLTEQEVKNG